MFQRMTENRTGLLLIGMMAGLCLANMWPHEQALAAATDRDEHFAILTVPVGALEGTEGIFILDFLTGRLSGAVLNNRNERFTQRYFKNVSQDFGNVKDPQYAIVAGRATLSNKGTVRYAGGVIYVAEMTTGKIICYKFPYSSANQPLAKFQRLIKMTEHSFRKAAVGEL